MRDKKEIKSTIDRLEEGYQPLIESISLDDNSVVIESTDKDGLELPCNVICEELARENKDITFGMIKENSEDGGLESIKIKFGTDEKEEAILFYLCAMGVPVEYTDEMREDFIEENRETLNDSVSQYGNKGFSKASLEIARPNNDEFGLFEENDESTEGMAFDL